MPDSSILGGARAPTQAAGRDADALGPSDTSDTGSDIQGERRLGTEPDDESELGATPTERSSDSDSSGTGERGSAVPDGARDAADIGTDRLYARPSVDAQDLADVSLDDPDEPGVEELALDEDDGSAVDDDDDLDDDAA